jgi:hypothetical protein
MLFRSREGSMKFHKTEIAKRQIDTAVDLFLEGKDFISALTLAGAGEEITGKLLDRKGKKSMLQKLHVWYQDVTGTKIDYGKFCQKTNLARNTLKHANNPEEDELEIQQWEAVQMIMRAMTNYKELVGEPSEKMKVMAKWLVKNKGKYENME